MLQLVVMTMLVKSVLFPYHQHCLLCHQWKDKKKNNKHIQIVKTVLNMKNGQSPISLPHYKIATKWIV